MGTCNMAEAASKLPWYFGLRFGDDMDKRLPTSGGGALDSERPLGATFGYNFREHFAVEGSISDLGRSELTGIADGGFALEGNVFTVGIVAQTEVNDGLAARQIAAGEGELANLLTGCGPKRDFASDPETIGDGALQFHEDPMTRG